jgi:hypothetical protein
MANFIIARAVGKLAHSLVFFNCPKMPQSVKLVLDSLFFELGCGG